MAAQGTDDFQMPAIDNCDVVAEIVVECHKVAAVETELPVFNRLNKDFSQLIGILVTALLCFGHGLASFPQKQKSPASAKGASRALFYGY